MPMEHFDPRRGASLIDLIVGLAILSLLFGGIYMVYFSILDATTNVELRTTAASVLNEQVEIIRNLPYDQVGTPGGAPAGVVPVEKTVNVGDKTFLVRTTIRNVDDPFDGTLGGSPNDTAPADYKLVAFDISCLGCPKFIPLAFTTLVAPKNLETAGPSGSLFVNVFDAAGQPVSGATVRITNASVTPSIDLTDITNTSGLLQLVGVPSSTQRYHIVVTKDGFSSDQTYAPGGAANPNPSKPDATVAVQSVTNVSFAIDQTSQLTVRTSNEFCAAIGGAPFSLTGGKTIGPGVFKFTTTSATDGGGGKTFAALEWDSYRATSTDGGYDVAGTLPLLPLPLDPNVSSTLRFILAPARPDAVLVTVRNGIGAGISDADLVLSKPGTTRALTTGRMTVTRSDWSAGQHSSVSASIDPDSLPGSIMLLVNASGTYPTPDAEWLISETIDLGGSNTTLFSFGWAGTSPAPAGPEAVRFQLAANNDGASWDFIGPDGTSGSYFTAASSATPAALNGKRYVRFKAYLSTLNENVAPTVDEVSFLFRGDCVPPFQSLFTDLPAGTYTLTASANGTTATSSVEVDANFQETAIVL